MHTLVHKFHYDHLRQERMYQLQLLDVDYLYKYHQSIDYTIKNGHKSSIYVFVLFTYLQQSVEQVFRLVEYKPHILAHLEISIDTNRPYFVPNQM